MKKKALALTLSLIMASSLLAACGSDNKAADSSASAQAETASAEDTSSVEESAADAQAEEKGVTAEAKDESRATSKSTGTKYDTVVVAVNADPQDLNPWNAIQGAKGYIYPCIYEELFDYDTEDYYPVLAEGYEIVDDLHWNVPIRQNIYDSEGNHITADDVLFSYQTNIDSGFAVKFGCFDHLEKIDDYTVQFVWTEPIDGISEAEWPLGNIPIFSQKAYEEGNFATNPVGTGPYVVDSFTAGSEVKLSLNPNYWCEDTSVLGKDGQGHSINVENIEFDVIAESAQQVIALQNGTIDFSYVVPEENLPDFEDGGQYADNYNVDISAGNGVYFLMGNMSGNSIWSDINFRKAVFYALDADAISAANGLWPSYAITSAKFKDFYDAWAKQDNYETVYDPEKAKEFLAQTNYNGETLTLLTSNSETYKNTVTMIQALLTQIGINTEIEIVEESASASMIVDPDAFDMYVAYYGGGSVVGGWNRVLNNTDYGNGCSAGMLNDPKLVEMYQECSLAKNYNVEKVTELEQYVIDNAYMYCFSNNTNSFVFTSDIAELGYKAQAGSPIIFDCDYYVD